MQSRKTNKIAERTIRRMTAQIINEDAQEKETLISLMEVLDIEASRSGEEHWCDAIVPILMRRHGEVAEKSDAKNRPSEVPRGYQARSEPRPLHDDNAP